MTVELDKKDLVSLVKGILPSYQLIDDPYIRQLGSYRGGSVNEWSWHVYKLEELTEETLFKLYQFIKRNKI